MVVRCSACGKSVTLSERLDIITFAVCKEEKVCDFQPIFFYKGYRGSLSYWSTEP